MNKTQFFMNFWEQVQKTPHWQTMVETVEDSPWHREANVAVHTTMCIQHYIETTAELRTPRQQIMTLMTLLFHDFGKPEAEEVLDRKDGSGQYRRYAGHEPKSANEFLSFMCEQHDLREQFFAQGFGWEDIRRIKFMIENHLPFGMTNPTKRANLRRAVIETLGSDEVCFYDQLWSDGNGRISDDHEAKSAALMEWIVQFQQVIPAPVKVPKDTAPTMYVLVGPVGAGKTTWVSQLKAMNRGKKIIVVSEDEYRVQYALGVAEGQELSKLLSLNRKDQYDACWRMCHLDDRYSRGYEVFITEKLIDAVKSNAEFIVIDRTNATRKSRSKWIQAGRQHGARITSVEFFVSEGVSSNRQLTRTDKRVPATTVHDMFMRFETPWVGVEVDDFVIVA